MQCHVHENEMVFGLVLEVCSCSTSFRPPNQNTCLKDVPTLEHWVFAYEKLIYHPKREIVSSSVSKLLKWSLFIVLPGLFRSWITETPITRSESCCTTTFSLAQTTHVACTFWLSHLVMSLNMLAEMIMSGKFCGACPVPDMNTLSFCRI